VGKVVITEIIKVVQHGELCARNVDGQIMILPCAELRKAGIKLINKTNLQSQQRRNIQGKSKRE
jgi:demethoxyubiquinone hydroxylase (CLK1/Coq7/Cat5 family)